MHDREPVTQPTVGVETHAVMTFLEVFFAVMQGELNTSPEEQHTSEEVAQCILAQCPWFVPSEENPTDHVHTEQIAGYLRYLFPHFMRNSRERVGLSALEQREPVHRVPHEDLDARAQECGYSSI
jgi:hypothetical protein